MAGAAGNGRPKMYTQKLRTPVTEAQAEAVENEAFRRAVSVPQVIRDLINNHLLYVDNATGRNR